MKPKFTEHIVSRETKMAQTYLYQYKGALRTKQDKCRTTMILDKSRIWLDFNEFCGTDEEDGSPVYLFSQADIVNDSNGNDIELLEGMKVSVFDSDLDALNMPDALLADGIITKNYFEQYPNVKWLIKLIKHKANDRSKEEYFYWMSDMQQTL